MKRFSHPNDQAWIVDAVRQRIYPHIPHPLIDAFAAQVSPTPPELAVFVLVHLIARLFAETHSHHKGQGEVLLTTERIAVLFPTGDSATRVEGSYLHSTIAMTMNSELSSSNHYFSFHHSRILLRMMLEWSQYVPTLIFGATRTSSISLAQCAPDQIPEASFRVDGIALYKLDDILSHWRPAQEVNAITQTTIDPELLERAAKAYVKRAVVGLAETPPSSDPNPFSQMGRPTGTPIETTVLLDPKALTEQLRKTGEEETDPDPVPVQQYCLVCKVPILATTTGARAYELRDKKGLAHENCISVLEEIKSGKAMIQGKVS